MIQDSKSVAQIAIDNPPMQSLWHFLAQLPMTMEAQLLYGLVIGGMVGVGVHFITQWAKGEIKGSLKSYMFIDNPRRSWLMIILLLTELIGEIGTGLFIASDGVFVGWGLVLLSGFKSGYTIDSLANKSDRPIWTDEQRDASLVKNPPPKAVMPVTGEKDK